jgi:hypothetical protein
METKVVKLEIGKLLAFVIAVVVVASVAGVVIQNNYFKGSVPGVDSGAYSAEVSSGDLAELAAKNYFDRIETFKINIDKVGYDKALSGLKYDLDVMVSEKIIGAEIAKETFEAFASTDDSKVAVTAIDNSILVAKSDIDDFIKEVDVSFQTAVKSLESDVLIDKIDILSNAITVDAVAVADVKESLIDAGISEIETVNFDASLIETVNTYEAASLDVAFESFTKAIEAGIDIEIAFDELDGALNTIKQDVAVEATSIELIKSIEAIDKDIDVQLNGWINTIDTLTIDSVTIDNGVLAKAIDSGKGFDVLAKSFDGFSVNIEKGMGIDLAVATLAKDIGGIMPGLLIIDAVKLK